MGFLANHLGRVHGLSASLFIALVLTPVAAAAHAPGNVHLAGDNVRIEIPESWTGWHAVDVEGNTVGQGTAQDVPAELGKLPTGYYEVLQKDGRGRVTVGVLTKTTFSEDTPIALDAAMAWFYFPDEQKIRDACALCRLAGVKWVRDRSSWPEIEPARGTWAEDGRYEQVMRIEHEEGLKVLQVNHIAPAWASEDMSRFPQDLRVVYEFYRGLAERWKGLADAIEPWNEPDIKLFGGHTGCEIASFQKAAYLGLKAGNPQSRACLACFAIDRQETLEEFGKNEVYPYFDQYHLHHYVGMPLYPRAYGRHRAVSGGRPMWTTEFNLPVHWADERTKEPSDEELRVQAFRVAKVFAVALNQGTEKAFYFILGDYVERKLQYGLVHQDLTPRPAYVAFAAVGRLLNGAQPIGRVDLGNDKLMGYAFKTLVDGVPQETLVAWSETYKTAVETRPAQQLYDYLGRKLPQAPTIELSREPVFMVLPPGGSRELKIEPPPSKAHWRTGDACPVVLQLIGDGDVNQSAFRLDAHGELRLLAYNFGETTARGQLTGTGTFGTINQVELAPGSREEWKIKAEGPGYVTVGLDLEDGGRAVVSGRVASFTEPSE